MHLTCPIGTVSFGSTSRAEDLNQKNGWELPILVDAASGGFVAPFLYPDLVWDFQLKNVHSICVSGHKYASAPFLSSDCHRRGMCGCINTLS